MPKASSPKILSLFLLDEIKEILYFPCWWYSTGLLKVLKGSWGFVMDFEETLGFWIWVKNLFVPMFGQRDIAGRLISFFLRLVQIIIKGLFLLVIMALALIFIFIWLILPLAVLYQIFINL